jgi:hypothetical protein
MERVWGHVMTGFVLVAGIGAAAGLVPACVHDNSTIFVSNVLAPTFVTAGMACTFTADPTQPVLGEGTLDVALRAQYTAEFLIGNQLVPRGDPNQPHTETSFVTIEGAVVRIVDSSGKQLNTYTQPAAATIPPSAGTTPGFASLGVPIVDSGTAKTLLGMFANNTAGTIPIVSYTRFFGHSLGGESVESNEFGFPINVCLGCLVSFPVASDDLNLSVQPNCGLAGASMMSSSSSTSVPCVPGQDLPVDCSACAATNPFCRTAGGQTATVVDAGGGGG